MLAGSCTRGWSTGMDGVMEDDPITSHDERNDDTDTTGTAYRPTIDSDEMLDGANGERGADGNRRSDGT